MMEKPPLPKCCEEDVHVAGDDKRRTTTTTTTRTKSLLCLLLVGVSVGLLLVSRSPSPHQTTARQIGHWQAAVPPSPLPYTTGKKVIALAASLAVPQIEAAVLENVFPSTSVSYVTIDPMHLESFSIRSLKVLLASPSSDNITVNIVDLKLTIPDTGFTFKYSFLTCPGVFRLRLDATQVSFNVHPFIVNETLAIAIGPESTNITWGAFNFEHDLDSVLCRIGQSIWQLFMGEMDALVEKNIKEELPVMLPQQLRENANSALASSGIRFSSPLSMTPDRAIGQVELIPSVSPWNASVMHASRTRPATTGAVLPYRDAALVLYSTSLNSLLAFAQGENWLNGTLLLSPNITAEDFKDVFPDAYVLCKNCSVAVGFAAAAPPVSAFAVKGSVASLSLTRLITGLYFLPHTAEQHAELVRGFRRLRASSGAAAERFPDFAATFQWRQDVASGSVGGTRRITWAVPVVAFSANATVAVGDLDTVGARLNAVQYRILPIADLSLSLVTSAIGPVDADKLAHDIAGVLNEFVIPLTNVDSPITIPGPIKDALLSVNDGSLTAGLNISFF